MKKSLLYLFTVLCVLSLFSSCKDDKETPEVPPTPADVIAEYTTDKLKAQVDGKDAAADAKINIEQEADKSLTIKLFNIVPGTKEFSVPKATFEAVTKSAYLSKLTGEASSDLAGYKVAVDGIVDEGVLTAKITLTPIEADSTDVTNLYGVVYKGDMEITVVGLGDPAKITQRIYVTKPYNKDKSFVKLEIKDFTFTGMNLGTISLDTIFVAKRGDVLLFSAEKREITLNGIGKVLVNVQGTIVDGKIDLNLTVDVPALKMNVAVAFNGVPVKESQVARITSFKLNSPVIADSLTKYSRFDFKVWESTSDKDLLLTPVLTLSDKATIDSIQIFNATDKTYTLLKEGEAIDFSKLKTEEDFVRYWLAAEDPNEKNNFLVYMKRIPVINTNFVFSNEWINVDNDYDGVSEYSEPMGWASSNLAAVFLKAMDLDDGKGPFYPANISYPISKEDTYAKVITVDTRGYSTLIPAITAGSLFLGTFSVDMMNTLKSTKFGIPYNQEPVSFNGRYKFTAGEKYYKVKSIDPETQEVIKEEVVGKVDRCAISAILYEVSSFEETLDGTNIFSSDKIVATAVINEESTSGFVDFDKKLEYIKTYDASKKYKLAVICSSSEKGADFEGAPGSTLLIDKLEVTTK